MLAGIGAGNSGGRAYLDGYSFAEMPRRRSPSKFPDFSVRKVVIALNPIYFCSSLYGLAIKTRASPLSA